MRSLRFRLSGFVKDRVLRFYRVPFSRFRLEPALVPFLPQGQPITLVDVGASIGSFTESVRDHCGLRRALLIEPQPDNVRLLQAQFSDARYHVSECAASDAEGSIEMNVLNFHSASSLLQVKPEFLGAGTPFDMRVRQRIKVRTRTLDSLLADVNWTEPVDLLKVDVQGAELMVLRGALPALERIRMVWIEVSFRPLYDESAVFSEVYEFMNRQGFQLHGLQEGYRGGDGEVLQADALFRSRQEPRR